MHRTRNSPWFPALLVLRLALTPWESSRAEPAGCESLNQRFSCAFPVPRADLRFEEWVRELETSGDLERFFAPDPDSADSSRKREFSMKLFLRLKDFKKRHACNPVYAFKPANLLIHEIRVEKSLRGPALKNFEEGYLRTHARDLDQKRRNLLEHLSRVEDQGGRITFCSKLPHYSTGTAVALLTRPCIMTFHQLLPDNEYRVERFLDSILASSEYHEGLECLNRHLETLARITIVASSSALNNRSPEFCKKDFIGLSRIRAERVRDVLLPIILKGRESTVETRLQYHGSNGDGTSGPCPYRRRPNGLEELIPGFLTNPYTRAELDAAKTLLVRFEFRSDRIPLENQNPTLTHALRCTEVELSCESQ